jgi:hypothetical protein
VPMGADYARMRWSGEQLAGTKAVQVVAVRGCSCDLPPSRK